jgi:hypothetical protein
LRARFTPGWLARAASFAVAVIAPIATIAPIVAIALASAVPAAGHPGQGQGPGSGGKAAEGSQPGIERIRLDVELDPESGEVRALARFGLDRRASGSVLTLELLEPLTVDSVTRDGVALRWAATPAHAGDVEGSVEVEGEGAHELEHPAQRLQVWFAEDGAELLAEDGAEWRGDAGAEVEIRYHGILREDWASGEKAGEIHNFAVEAHVGLDGIYLSNGVPWYPRPPRPVLEERSPDGQTPDGQTRDGQTPVPLIDHELRLRGVPGMLLVASGNRVSAGDPVVGADEVWRTPFPLPGIAVAGGARRPFARRVGEVTVVAHLTEASSGFADLLLDAAASYLDLYQPLVGAYPFRELAIVENFFSSGFAYPGFTLLASAVIQMGESSLRPGYLDHEMLHAWWGNGVLGEPGAGVWSEGLASYCANLMRDTLEGRHDVARAQRRSILERLSQLDAEVDRPLATFGVEVAGGNGASRFIGYQKGSVVFAELGRQVGTDRLWYALRNLAATRMGRFTTWADIQESFERSTGRDLDAFFDYWVRGSGVPDVSPREAVWTLGAGAAADGGSAGAGELRLELSGPVPVAVPSLPVRLVGMAGRAGRAAGSVADDAAQVVTVDVAAGDAAISIPFDGRPDAVEVDPEFATVRRLPPAVWMPTISGISAAQPLRIVRAESEEPALDERYEVVAGALRERYEKRGELSEERVRVSRRARRSQRIAAWGPGHLLVLGRAAFAPAAVELLAEAALTVDGQAGSFTLEGVEHAAPTDSVLACVRRPGTAGAVACIVWGNSAQALARAHLLTFYGGDSLLRFAEGRPVERRRFEGVERIAVTGGG